MPSTSLRRPLPVWALSLGCPKNRVDSERLLGSLGVAVKPAAHMGRSRLVFINTCGFIEPAVRESIRAVLDAAQHLGKLRRRPLLAVAGCMVGRYGVAELAKELPEVDLWLPTEDLARWPALVRAALGLAPAQGSGAFGRLLSTGPAYAWLKVGEGCRHSCAFCTIPSIRGPLRSTPAEALLAEARTLLGQGVRELDLVAQDVSAWGSDFSGGAERPRLEDLITALAGLDGLFWLRLLYLYPTGITEALLRRMAELGPPVLPYFDIPFQHAAPELLRAMGRPFAGDPRRVLERVRNILPDAALRTTFIVGYPGETEAQFLELCRFVEEARFTHLGVFAYQAEDGTPAAKLPGQVPMAVREERRATLMELQASISADILAQTVGSRLPVLVDAPADEWPGLHRGRVWFQAPEVDGVTWVSGPGVTPGAVVEGDIVESSDYDLSALA
ncbi:MAG: 30S ribosomal protein S12 methylthiotransferase RimO [Desulfovibrio sp.]|uniref:30S ribosomal protein S12 methylthiotransferase RimO n=1 Tax=Desulfovibrio sp. TaxID=885 RepID=UPI001A67FCAE|nr:30S ribosomal protein S12 methylthiotransferase RimO [Desulfovibrio sp.]MBD5416893.1 30S ribosomal protein S12 methylthiotransferase RimO [Desulfovibrio sp.]